MQESKKIDYSKLLGFVSVSDHLSGEINFQDETIGARLGAKVGDEVAEPSRRAETGTK